MKVLVTGGGGFLGSAICRQLLVHGDDVIAYQRSASEELEKLGVRIIPGSITDAEMLNAALKGVDAVIHTAAKAGIWGPYDDYFRPNVLGTENVLAACRNNGIRKLVFTSSPSVTHADGDIEGDDESLPYAEHTTPPTRPPRHWPNNWMRLCAAAINTTTPSPAHTRCRLVLWATTVQRRQWN